MFANNPAAAVRTNLVADPGLEPGLRGYRPRVLTIELIRHNFEEPRIRAQLELGSPSWN